MTGKERDKDKSLEDISKATHEVGDKTKKELKKSGITKEIASGLKTGSAELTGGASMLIPDALIEAGVNKVANKAIDTVADTTANTVTDAMTPEPKKKKPSNEGDNEDDTAEEKKDIKSTQAGVGERARAEDEKFKGHSYADVAGKIMADIVEKGAAKREEGIAGLVPDIVQELLSKPLVERHNPMASSKITLSPLPDTKFPSDDLKKAMADLISIQAANIPKQSNAKENLESTAENENRGPKGP